MTGMSKAVTAIHMDTLLMAMTKGKFNSLRPAFSLSIPSGFSPRWIIFAMEDMGRWTKYCNKVTNKKTERIAIGTTSQKPSNSEARHSLKTASGVKKFSITIMKLPEKLAT